MSIQALGVYLAASVSIVVVSDCFYHDSAPYSL